MLKFQDAEDLYNVYVFPSAIHQWRENPYFIW